MSRMRSSLSTFGAAAVLATALLASGCGGQGESPVAAATAPAPVPPAVTAQQAIESGPKADTRAASVAEVKPEAEVGESCLENEEQRLGSPKRALAALARVRTVGFRKPGGRPLQTFERLNVNNYPTVFGVLGVVRDEHCEPIWYRVQLPIRPNGAVGYVRAPDVEIVGVRTRIEIDLSERTLNLYRDGRLLRRFTTAIGTDATPTPVGRYYVNQRLRAGDPAGPWGPAALGVSAFSPVLVDWAQGGPIGIHGTNDPASVGNAASNGCLRLTNENLTWLYERTPAGTPVVIRS
jgi:lipoprotein-anchoring transpeptidase ErfK/SrfK